MEVQMMDGHPRLVRRLTEEEASALGLPDPGWWPWWPAAEMVKQHPGWWPWWPEGEIVKQHPGCWFETDLSGGDRYRSKRFEVRQRKGVVYIRWPAQPPDPPLRAVRDDQGNLVVAGQGGGSDEQ